MPQIAEKAQTLYYNNKELEGFPQNLEGEKYKTIYDYCATAKEVIRNARLRETYDENGNPINPKAKKHLNIVV